MARRRYVETTTRVLPAHTGPGPSLADIWRRRDLPLRTAMARRRYVETTTRVLPAHTGPGPSLADIWRRRDLRYYFLTGGEQR